MAQTVSNKTAGPMARAKEGTRDRPMLRYHTKESLMGWLFASPWIIGFLLFTVIPMGFSFYTSFTKYNITTPPKFIGVQNYQQIAHDPFFYTSLENTVWMVVIKIPLVIAFSIAIAILLNTDVMGGKFFRTVFYLPNVLAGVAAVFLWQWVLAPNGLFNQALARIGIQGPAWFSDPRWTKPGMVVMGMWWIGGQVLIFLAGLKGIPTILYEAASIDGATGWRKVRYITLPMLSPTIFFVIVTGIIGAFQIFTTAYILTGTSVSTGGPGQSLLFYVLYLYNRAFGKLGAGGFDMGYASALAWILFVIILVVTALQLALARRWVYYESEGR
jgi:multiple sugar transport system permease protein